MEHSGKKHMMLDTTPRGIGDDTKCKPLIKLGLRWRTNTYMRGEGNLEACGVKLFINVDPMWVGEDQHFFLHERWPDIEMPLRSISSGYSRTSSTGMKCRFIVAVACYIVDVFDKATTKWQSEGNPTGTIIFSHEKESRTEDMQCVVSLLITTTSWCAGKSNTT